MKSYIIGKSDAGKRLDKWLLKELPALPVSLAQKYIRLKRVKLNGKRTDKDARLSEGDVIELYINDEYFEVPARVDLLLNTFRHRIVPIYEDEHILIIDKPVGLLVHPDENEKLNTLVTHARAYLYQKGEYDSLAEGSFAPVPCNRIDRFTGGIVLIAKTHAAMSIINKKIREHEIEKGYIAIALGSLQRRRGLIDNYILKEPGRRKVSVLHRSVPGAQQAKTRYEVLDYLDGLSLVECTLITGRTHQIRAQFADMGHPLLGDGQYGDPSESRRFGREQQALYAYKLTFNFGSDAGVLEYLKGQSFSVANVPFVEEYFR